MSRDDYETRDEAGAAAFERDNTWPDEQPDLRDLVDDEPCVCGQPWNRPDAVEHTPTHCAVKRPTTTSTTTTEGHES